jgi:hypothetical protein
LLIYYSWILLCIFVFVVVVENRSVLSVLSLGWFKEELFHLFRTFLHFRASIQAT